LSSTNGQFKKGQSGNLAGRPKGAFRYGMSEKDRQELARRMGITPLELLL
jgi:hypothetical protein